MMCLDCTVGTAASQLEGRGFKPGKGPSVGRLPAGFLYQRRFHFLKKGSFIAFCNTEMSMVELSTDLGTYLCEDICTCCTLLCLVSFYTNE